MKNILIITRSNDNSCIETVSEEIYKLGGKPIRFNTDEFPTNIELSQRFNNDQDISVLLKIGDKNIDIVNDIDAIWYRRSSIGANIPKDMDKQLLGPAINESKNLFQGAINSLDVFKFDNIANVRRASDKHLQLKIAKNIGLTIPDTLITNSADIVRSFYNKHQRHIVTKMHSSFAVYRDGIENVVFTNDVTKEHIEDLEGLNLCPMVFQNKIEKKLELRVTVVGYNVFSYSIDSQSSEDAKTDWRKEGNTMVGNWKPYELPQKIKNKLFRLMDYLNLNYGAIDIILSPDNEYVFLEINPAGEFFWLDRLANYDISKAIAGILINANERRVNENIYHAEKLKVLN